MSAAKLKKIVFVCTGNTCRSPMAEYLLKKILKEKKLRGFKISSAGVGAKKGDPINPKSAYILEEQGIKLGKFSAAPVSEKLLKEAFAFVCMTERHKDYLMDMRWNVLRKAGEEEIENNIYSFYELAGCEVPDPYGMDVDKYRYVYKLLEEGMYALIDNLHLKDYALPTKAKASSKEPKKRGRPRKDPVIE